MSKPVLYLSFDVETDGPTPLVNNLLSVGIIGLEENTSNIVFEFEANIKPLESHKQDTQCMESFWLKPEQKEAWEYLQTNQKDYLEVFEDLSSELKKLDIKYKLVWVAYPACFDWMFFKSYYELAKSSSLNEQNFYDIGYQCKCISTLFDLHKKINDLLPNEATKLFNDLGQVEPNHNHKALYDAKVQGKFYIKLMKIMLN